MPFEKGEFDVALFSHNGIDYVDSEGRDAILREVGRVLSRNGLFVFSTHNLLRSDFEAGHTGAWSRVRAKFRRWRLRRANPEWRSWQGATSAFINDGAFRQRLLTYHVRPSVQIAALEVAGFDDIRIFCGSSGTEVHRERSDELCSPWFYVSCRHGTSRPGPNPCGARLPRARAA